MRIANAYVARLAQAKIALELAKLANEDALDHVERRLRHLPRRRQYDVYHGKQAMDVLCAPLANLR